MMYILIYCTNDNRCIFPCELRDLSYALETVQPTSILEEWPRHGHGEEWRMYSSDKPSFDQGVMVLNMNTNKPMTKEQLKQLGVLR